MLESWRARFRGQRGLTRAHSETCQGPSDSGTSVRSNRELTHVRHRVPKHIINSFSESEPTDFVNRGRSSKIKFGRTKFVSDFISNGVGPHCLHSDNRSGQDDTSVEGINV